MPQRVRELAAALLRLTSLRAGAAEAEALKVRCQVIEVASYKQAGVASGFVGSQCCMHLHLAMHSAGHWTVRRLSLVTCMYVGAHMLCMQPKMSA